MFIYYSARDEQWLIGKEERRREGIISAVGPHAGKDALYNEVGSYLMRRNTEPKGKVNVCPAVYFQLLFFFEYDNFIFFFFFFFFFKGNKSSK